MGKLLKKSDIFAKKALDPRTIHIPEWGGDVRYKPMTMVERKECRKRSTTPGTDSQGNATIEVDQELLEVWAIITCTLQPEGNGLMFDREDITILHEQMAAGAVGQLSVAILRASGLAPDAFPDSEDEAED